MELFFILSALILWTMDVRVYFKGNINKLKLVHYLLMHTSILLLLYSAKADYEWAWVSNVGFILFALGFIFGIIEEVLKKEK